MRKRVLVLAFLAACLIGGVAHAQLRVGSGFSARGFATGARATYRDSSLHAYSLPSTYLVYAKDGSQFYVRRVVDSTVSGGVVSYVWDR